MLYALNLYNIKCGKTGEYRRYINVATPILDRLGGRIVAGGCNPQASIGDDKARQYFLLVEYPDRAALDKFSKRTAEQGMHGVRADATYDYLWTLFEPWNPAEPVVES